MRALLAARRKAARSDQEVYAEAWVKEKRARVVVPTLWLAVGLHVLCWAVMQLLMSSANQELGGAVNAPCLVVLGVGLAGGLRGRARVARAALVIYHFLLLSLLVAAWYHLEFDLRDTNTANAALATLGAVKGDWLFVVSILISFVMGITLRLVLQGMLKITARTEYRYRLVAIPRHIVQSAAGAAGDLEKLLAPKLRCCVCISSDWRDYQRLSGALSPGKLTRVLNDYYQLTYRLLEQYVPEGTFFADWIADEFFAVIYSENPGDEAALAARAFAFGSSLLRAKERFAKVNGVPRGIDVGIAVGEALIGLMGAREQRKTTAIGEAAGRARQLQGMGKRLRREVGEEDRLIFGGDVERHLRQLLPGGALGDRRALLDGPDEVVYFVGAVWEDGLEAVPALRRTAREVA